VCVGGGNRWRGLILPCFLIVEGGDCGTMLLCGGRKLMGADSTVSYRLIEVAAGELCEQAWVHWCTIERQDLISTCTNKLLDPGWTSVATARRLDPAVSLVISLLSFSCIGRSPYCVSYTAFRIVVTLDIPLPLVLNLTLVL
jgi:hypothetical protein